MARTPALGCSPAGHQGGSSRRLLFFFLFIYMFLFVFCCKWKSPISLKWGGRATCDHASSANVPVPQTCSRPSRVLSESLVGFM